MTEILNQVHDNTTKLSPDLEQLVQGSRDALRIMGIPITNLTVVGIVSIVRHDDPDAVDQVRRWLAVAA